MEKTKNKITHVTLTIPEITIVTDIIVRENEKVIDLELDLKETKKIHCEIGTQIIKALNKSLGANLDTNVNEKNAYEKMGQFSALFPVNFNFSKEK